MGIFTQFSSHKRYGLLCAVMAAGIGSLLSLAIALLRFNSNYTLFIAIPVAIGVIASLSYCADAPKPLHRALLVGAFANLLATAMQFAIGVDGLIFLVLAAPLSMLLGVAGALVSRQLSEIVRSRRSQTITLIIALSSIPISGAIESQISVRSPMRRVVSTIEISAAPVTVWPSVIAYPEIRDEPGPAFQVGLSYPLKAEIEGEGLGAKRKAIFSTGVFEQSIVGWEKDRLLLYNIEKAPTPINEIFLFARSPFVRLENFMQARAGQFRLAELDGSSTRLECTTWYYHDIGPISYWGAIADHFVHKAQLRTLRQIKKQSERSLVAVR